MWTPLRTILAGQQRINGPEILTVTLDHVLAMEGLPLHRNDPFERLLIALAAGLTVGSADRIFSQYSVPLVW